MEIQRDPGGACWEAIVQALSGRSFVEKLRLFIGLGALMVVVAVLSPLGVSAQSGDSIDVTGRGASGGEQLQVSVNGSVVSTISFTTTSTTESASLPEGTTWNEIELQFTDAPNMDLTLTGFGLGSETRSMTAGDVRVSGQWTGSTCSGLGDPIHTTIHCDGVVQFPAQSNNGGGPLSGIESDLDPSFFGNAQTVVPVYDTAWDLGVSARTGQVEEYSEWLADSGFSGFATTYLGAIHRPAARDDQGDIFTRDDPYGNPIATWDEGTGNLILGAAHADRFEEYLDAAHAEGQRVLLYVIWERKAVEEFELINEDNAYEWARQLGSRFGNHPAIQSWILGGDAGTDNPRAQLWANAEAGLRDAGVSGFVEYGTGSAPERRINNLDEPWNQGQHVQTSHCGTPDLIDQRLSRVVNLADIPVWAGEMRYENINATWCEPAVPIPGAAENVADALAAIEAGADGVVFGHNDRWQWGHGSLGGGNQGWTTVRQSFTAPGAHAVIAALTEAPPEQPEPAPEPEQPQPEQEQPAPEPEAEQPAPEPEAEQPAPEPEPEQPALELEPVETAPEQPAAEETDPQELASDVTAPVVSVVSPAAGSEIDPGVADLVIRSVDPSGVADVVVNVRNESTDEYWNGFDWVSSSQFRPGVLRGSDWVISNIDFEPGEIVVRVYSTDGLGNRTTFQETIDDRSEFTVLAGPAADETAPVVSVVSPAAGSVIEQGVSDLVISSVDPSGVARVMANVLNESTGEYWNGSGWSSSKQFRSGVLMGSDWVIPNIDFESGDIVVRVYSTDALGNRTTYSETVENRTEFTVSSQAGPETFAPEPAPDVTAPLVSVVSPGFGVLLEPGVDDLLISSVDPSGVARVIVNVQNETTGEYWNGSGWSSSIQFRRAMVVHSDWVIPNIDFESGDIVVRVYSTDALGNRTTYQETVDNRTEFTVN